MIPVERLRIDLWRDQAGSVVVTELIGLAGIAILGLIVSFSTMRDAVICEISDVVGSVQDLQQSYSYNGSVGQSASASGSAFADALDVEDDPDDVSGQADNCITMQLAPTDERELLSIRLEAESSDVTKTTGGPYPNAWNLWTVGRLFADIEVPEDGDYTFSARLWASRGGPDIANAELLVDGNVINDFDIFPETSSTAQVYSVVVSLIAGTYQFAVGFTNDFYQPPIDRNLFIDWIQVDGPN